MNKFTNCLLALLAAILSCALGGCGNDEPSVDFDIPTKMSNQNQSLVPFGYSDISVKFVCSDYYLDLSSPMFLIGYKDRIDTIETTRDDFKLSKETVPVALKVNNGDYSEIVNRELTYYEYSFNERIENTDETVVILAKSNINDDAGEKFKEWLRGSEECFPIFRGFYGLDMNYFCPNGIEMKPSNAWTFGDINGYLMGESVEDFIIALFTISSSFPTIMIRNYSSNFIIDYVELSPDDFEDATTTSHSQVQTSDAIRKLMDNSDLKQKTEFRKLPAFSK